MRFDYIRAIDPPAPDEPITPLEPLQPKPPTAVDDADLDELVASACHDAAANAGLATSEAPALELPAFLGGSLACTRLESARPDDPIFVERSRSLRVWLGPGMITMALAVAATLAFSVLVIMW